jgi:hypothetical protein
MTAFEPLSLLVLGLPAAVVNDLASSSIWHRLVPNHASTNIIRAMLLNPASTLAS